MGSSMSITQNVCRWMTMTLALASASAALAQSVTIPAAVEKVAQAQITKDTLEAPIRFLADDLLEGRGPATRGEQLARLYVARELQSLGYQPGAPGGKWEQPIDIVGVDTQAPKVWTFSGKGGNVDLKFFDDYTGSSGVQTPSGGFENADVVFIGYGIAAPEYKWDDFKGVDVKGK